MGWLSQLPGRLADAYDGVQVELHGQYSLSRLEDLSQFNSTTSLWRAFSIIILTPLPALLAIIMIDIAPLNSAYAGVYDQTMWYWVRVWITVILITMSTIMQFHQSAPTLPMPRRRLWIISITLGASAPLVFFANGVLLGFPTPFAMQLYAIPWFFTFTAALGVSWLPTLRVDTVARRNLTAFLLAYSSELAIIFVYPVYFYIFTLLHGLSQTAFSLVLPIMKLIFKNWVSTGTFHMEDLAPTTIVFNIDVFHALFLSTAAQKSKSMGATLVIMTVDVVQMVVSFVEINKVLARQEESYSMVDTIDSASSTPSGPHIQPRRDVIGDARHLVRNNSRLQDHPDLALPRHLRQQPPRLLSSFSFQLPRNSKVDVFPQRAAQETKLSSFTTNAEQVHVKNVACTLQILHMTEFYVLIEFAEVMMSCSLVIYLSVISRLPNRVHYETLKALSDEERRAMIENVAVYALLELASFVVLCVGLNWKLKGYSSIRQLAFALRRHWQMTQAMLILWTVFVMQLSLTHVGSDYSFKFAWLHNNSTSHPPLLPRKAAKMMLNVQHLRQLLALPALVYDKAQVELQGQYSLARLHKFAQYECETSLGWTLAVVLLTPLLALVTIIVLDFMPMHSAYGGVYNQTPWLWFRAFFLLGLITMSVIMQLHQRVPTLPMSRIRLLTISASLGTLSAAIFFALGGRRFPHTFCNASCRGAMVLDTCCFLVDFLDADAPS